MKQRWKLRHWNQLRLARLGVLFGGFGSLGWFGCALVRLVVLLPTDGSIWFGDGLRLGFFGERLRFRFGTACLAAAAAGVPAGGG